MIAAAASTRWSSTRSSSPARSTDDAVRHARARPPARCGAAAPRRGRIDDARSRHAGVGRGLHRAGRRRPAHAGRVRAGRRAVARRAGQPARRPPLGARPRPRPTPGGSSPRSTGTATSAVPPRCSRGRTRRSSASTTTTRPAVGALATASLGAWRRGDLGTLPPARRARRWPGSGAASTRFARTALRGAAGWQVTSSPRSSTARPCLALARASWATRSTRRTPTPSAPSPSATSAGSTRRRSELAAAAAPARSRRQPVDCERCAPTSRGRSCVDVGARRGARPPPGEHRRSPSRWATTSSPPSPACRRCHAPARIGDPACRTRAVPRRDLTVPAAAGLWTQLWTALRTLVEALAHAGTATPTRQFCSVPCGRPDRVRRSAALTPSDWLTSTPCFALGSVTTTFERLISEGAVLGDEAASRPSDGGRRSDAADWQAQTSAMARLPTAAGSFVAVAGSLDGALSSTACAWLSISRVNTCWAYPSTME